MGGHSFDAWMENQSIQLEESNAESKALTATLMELVLTKEELGKARETNTQSCLDSKPLIDELEKLQSEVTNTKNKISMATVTISTLEAELEATEGSSRSKEKAELKARIAIEELGRILDQTQSEVDKLKVKTGKESRARAKLKKELRLRRQSLRALQFTQRAAVVETEAISTSLAAVLDCFKQSKAENTLVELALEEYHALNRKADEETSLADRRISASMEQRQLAEANREEALRRLGLSYSKNQSRRRQRLAGVIIEDEQTREEVAKEDIRVGSPPTKEIIGHPNSPQDQQVKDKEKKKFSTRRHNPQRRMRRSQSRNPKKIVANKKQGLLHQLTSFLARSFRRVFG
ncbi:hypothetical protein ACLOJK_016463 [Asimina triloba]